MTSKSSGASVLGEKKEIYMGMHESGYGLQKVVVLNSDGVKFDVPVDHVFDLFNKHLLAL